ncbi:MAG TPA: 16S rRNA (uracil(1498)-N(3))-methyltransferase [Ramlibacter sp.]|nr:16S rRNA (uracil(1498)-N(3))-methyltransferase [Ramlibacter sp.]
MSRLYCPGPLAPGPSFELPARAARHVQVLRMQPGQEVALFNGEGGQWRAVIERMGRSDVEVRVIAHEDIECEAPVRVHLAVGIPANERMDWLVEKATELGCASIQPLVTARAILRVAGERAEKKRDHWQAIAAAACEQSGRNRVPVVHEPRAFPEWVDSAASVGAQKVVLSLQASAQALSLDSRLANQKDWMCLSGPEGGLEAREEDTAVAAGFTPVSLGSRILRADTAPIALLAAVVLSAPR